MYYSYESNMYFAIFAVLLLVIQLCCSYSTCLQVVSLARDVGGGLLAGREPDEDALPVRRVGLLRLLDHRLYHDAPERNRKFILRQKKLAKITVRQNEQEGQSLCGPAATWA